MAGRVRHGFVGFWKMPTAQLALNPPLRSGMFSPSRTMVPGFPGLCEKFHKARLRVGGRVHIVKAFFQNA